MPSSFSGRESRFLTRAPQPAAQAAQVEAYQTARPGTSSSGWAREEITSLAGPRPQEESRMPPSEKPAAFRKERLLRLMLKPSLSAGGGGEFGLRGGRPRIFALRKTAPVSSILHKVSGNTKAKGLRIRDGNNIYIFRPSSL